MRVEGSLTVETRREFSNHVYGRHNDMLKMLEDAAPKEFWTCGTPLWMFPKVSA